MVVCSLEMKKYFDSLEEEFKKAYSIASEARSLRLDPEEIVEIQPAKDVASRVEGLVGPKGIADRIRELSHDRSREEAIFELAKEILEGKYNGGEPKEKLFEQAVRTGLALFTEGVVSAPIEGVSRVKAKKNQDGSTCLAVYFAGPIRGAGGTGEAFTVLLADYCRKLTGLMEYRPTEDEVERYVEELNLYSIRTRGGQYIPTEEEVRHIIRNCPVCIEGEPTEDYEVSVHKNVSGIETNRVRGGVCLVISEGLCLKAAKILKISKKAGVDWGWIQALIKVAKQEAKGIEIKPVEKYMEELVAGRPIFAYPMRPGGFRLRYGRTRLCGIASKAIHPATMVVLNEFPAIGTQVKIERPGKGCITTPCESIEGPIVRLKSGEVRQIDSVGEAREIKDEVEEILFLGDLLVNYGDFMKANHPLVQSGMCEEWYALELKKAGLEKTIEGIKGMGAQEAFELSSRYSVPLHPRFTYFWHDFAAGNLKELAEWLVSGRIDYEWFEFKGFRVESSERKRILELLGVPHKLNGNQVILDKEHGFALLSSLGLIQDRKLSDEKFTKMYSESKSPMELVNELSGIKILKRAGIYVGASMGRPEKSKERKMQPPVHVLFPVSHHGGKTRSLVKAYRSVKGTGEKMELELANRVCPNCGKSTYLSICVDCNAPTKSMRRCVKCGKMSEKKECSCGGQTRLSEKQMVDFAKLYESAKRTAGFEPEEIKGVIGLISEAKTAEPLEKGFLRAKYDASVFRDGTCRYDATEVPMTHFVPAEIDLSLEKLKELSYENDAYEKPIESKEQIVELKAQDIIVSEHAGETLVRISQFIDDLLVYFYKMPPYYNAKQKEDLIGTLLIGIAPHTSAGALGRLIGFTSVKGIVAHPYFHCACRRNCDGDELCVVLLLDGLLNFSKRYLPETRGGWMDAPLVLTTVLDPREVDDEVHAMDVCWSYPLEFYEATLRGASPSEVKIETVATRLGSESQYEGFGFTHSAKCIGPIQSRYVQLKNMTDKVKEELDLMARIRAVDSAGAAEKIILAHFLPDLYGNLRSFSRQIVRCVECNAKYRRIPLVGKCTKCGGKLLLTISRGGIEKYLQISLSMVEKYNLPLYLKQRLILLEKEIKSIFEDDKCKQFSLADYA
ncbi:DNA polymerase II large subunit [Candidatus Micrarchaeota archaeon]|nr:DNA polymerase II large subunit [Candidatus Micrarchaeota archaeon]